MHCIQWQVKTAVNFLFVGYNYNVCVYLLLFCYNYYSPKRKQNFMTIDTIDPNTHIYCKSIQLSIAIRQYICFTTYPILNNTNSCHLIGLHRAT